MIGGGWFKIGNFGVTYLFGQPLTSNGLFSMHVSEIRVRYWEKPQTNVKILISYLDSPCWKFGRSCENPPATVYVLTSVICGEVSIRLSKC